ncbi:unnamed protein product [Brachionus calyciflorus]|uniref:Uncharacterized protein n=1 Tax=Brachionus calyciflorus TaxID=104777 RepID=A0A814KFQ2_9BILA|nr:unnamed protein product [Brachionus calyciflorus]
MNFSSEKSNPLFATGLNNGPSVLNSSVKVRLGFLKKVYGILSIQLAFTTVMSAIIMMSPSVQIFIFRNQWILWLSLIGNLATSFGIMYKRNEYPTNFYILGAFTFFNSITIGITVAQYSLALVAQAFLLTAAITVGLTIYAFTSKTDMTFLGNFLYTAITAMFFGSLIHLFFGNSFTNTAMAVMGACLFSGYIVYDTQLIMKHLSAEEYIVGVLNLYLDIINLFLKVLKILKALNGDEEKRNKKQRD